jgi:hypothetical protein
MENTNTQETTQRESLFINGINNKLIHERTNKEGQKFYNIGFPVQKSISDNGIMNVNVRTVVPSKSKEGYSNIPLVKGVEFNAQVKKGEEYQTIRVDAAKVNDYVIKARQERNAEKEAEKSEPITEKESEGIELG